MLCQKCKKQTATVHLRQNINGEQREAYLCHDCASGEGINPFNLMEGSFFAPFFNPFGGGDGAPATETERICPQCSMSRTRLLSDGKPGCDGCYDAFRDILTSAARRIHGNVCHRGRVPVGKSGEEARVRREIEKLNGELLAAVERQEYEKAAKLRDRIKELKGGSGNEG